VIISRRQNLIARSSGPSVLACALARPGLHFRATPIDQTRLRFRRRFDEATPVYWAVEHRAARNDLALAELRELGKTGRAYNTRLRSHKEGFSNA
jgi:hypothetical protein